MYYLVRHTAAQSAPPCTWSCSTYAAGSDRRYAATDTEPGKGLVRLELDISIYIIYVVLCDLILGAVGHVDQPLVEPALLNVAAHGPQHQPVIPHLAQYAHLVYGLWYCDTSRGNPNTDCDCRQLTNLTPPPPRGRAAPRWGRCRCAR